MNLSLPRGKKIRQNSHASLSFLTGGLFSIRKEQQCERKFFSLQHAGFYYPGLFHAPVTFADYIYRAHMILNMQYIWDVNLMVIRAANCGVRELTQYISNL